MVDTSEKGCGSQKLHIVQEQEAKKYDALASLSFFRQGCGPPSLSLSLSPGPGRAGGCQPSRTRPRARVSWRARASLSHTLSRPRGRVGILRVPLLDFPIRDVVLKSLQERPLQALQPAREI